MAICKFFLEGRCRYGDKCWNEHPRGGGGGGGGGGRRQEQGRYDYQAPPASSRWTSPAYSQRYVQPSNFSKSTTWTRDNNQPTFASHADPHDNKGRHYNSAPQAGHYSQNRFSTLTSQDHTRDTSSDKDGNLIETLKNDLDLWESSGQWIFSTYCVRDGRNITGFTDLSPEELRLECYTARDSGNMQNYINTVQQLISQWKQRLQAIRKANVPSQSALLDELTKPTTSSAPTFGGQQSSGFPTASSSSSAAAKPTVNFSFKQESQFPSPTKGPVSSFPTATGFGNAATTGSAASFSFAAPSDGGASGFGNANTVTAATFSFAPTTSSTAGTSGFGAAAVPASTSNTTVPFGGTAAPFGGTTAPFGGSTAPFGAATATIGGSTAPFGGTTAVSGFGQSTTSAFGGGTTTGTGFGQSTPSAFGGASSAFGFGATAASNTVTSGFGAKTSAVSELFKAGAASSTTSVPFGQASGFSVSRPPNVTTAEASSENPIFTPRSALSARELSQFEAKKFTLGNIPLRPPPSNLLTV